MELREMSESCENQEKDVTLTPGTADKPELTDAAAAETVTNENNPEAATTEAAPAVDNTQQDAAEPEQRQARPTDYSALDKQGLVAALEEQLQRPIEAIRDDVNLIKVAFYTLRNAEVAAEREAFIANGNEEAAFAPKEDPDEVKFKELLNTIKEKRAEFNAEQEAAKEENLKKKQAIIDEINSIVGDPDNINKQYNRIQQLQQEFKAIGEVPAANVTETWKNYQKATENFYDLLKMNKELRDYDFKKNLEAKQQLCAEAEALDSLEDVLLAFRKLQDLHNQWREIGPVAKEIREELWTRFKDASAKINKKYQAYFENRKEKEKENEQAKIALCERIEAIDIDALKTFAKWDEATKAIIALQEEWKKLGFASRKVNADLFARFRQTCDKFFARKAEFFKAMKEEFAANLEKKIALCEKAEALKDSTDWKKTADKLIALQKEWKTIGPVVKKHSDAVWKRFIAACDYFFDQKNKQTSSVHQAEHANLAAKREIIDAVNALLADEAETEGAKKVRQLMKKWQEIGHVPFKEKDKIYAEYKATIDKAFEKFDMKETRAELSNFESSLGSSSQDKIYRERERLVRAYEQKCNELKTYENNLGFFNAQSKGGNSMLKEVERRIQKIKDELAVLEQKIKLADEKL